MSPEFFMSVYHNYVEQANKQKNATLLHKPSVYQHTSQLQY